MGFDYFYGEQSEQFTFYRVPKLLFTNPCFKSISTDSKILYGLMLDRMSLSQKNGWFDEKKIRKICNADGKVRLVITLGYAKEPEKIPNKKRKSIDELVTRI